MKSSQNTTQITPLCPTKQTSLTGMNEERNLELSAKLVLVLVLALLKICSKMFLIFTIKTKTKNQEQKNLKMSAFAMPWTIILKVMVSMSTMSPNFPIG
jgi:hypothetical protein